MKTYVFHGWKGLTHLYIHVYFYPVPEEDFNELELFGENLLKIREWKSPRKVVLTRYKSVDGANNIILKKAKWEPSPVTQEEGKFCERAEERGKFLCVRPNNNRTQKQIVL